MKGHGSTTTTTTREFPARPMRKPVEPESSDGDDSDTYVERASSVNFSLGRRRSSSQVSSTGRPMKAVKRKGGRKHRGKPRPDYWSNSPEYWTSNPNTANNFGLTLEQMQKIVNQNTPLPQRSQSGNLNLSNQYTKLSEINSTSQESVILNTK